MTRVQTNGLQVEPVLHDFIEREALNGTGVSAEAFWKGLAGLVKEFAHATANSSPSATGSRRRSTSITAPGPDARSIRPITSAF
jgi:malate synthase